MNEKLFESFADQTNLFFGPLKQINQNFVTQLEKLNEFQMESIKSYSNIGLNRLKEAVKIEGAQSVQEFAKGETDFMKNLNQKLMEDAKKLTEISNGFKAEVEDLMKESVAQVTTPEKEKQTKAKAKAA